MSHAKRLNMALYSDIDIFISAGEPSGPDPDLDPDVMNFMAVAEGQLPPSYREFNRKAFDAKPILKSLTEHLARSRDIRFLVMAAKYHILSDDLVGFSDAIAALSRLLSRQWETCHPAEATNRVELRAAYLRSLDDLPTSVLPFQNSTLLVDRRTGAVTVRTVLLAKKLLAARAGESALDESTVRDIFIRFESFEDVLAIHNAVQTIVRETAAIKQLFIDKVGYGSEPSFDQLSDLSQKIGAFLQDIVNTRAPQPEATNAGGGAAESADAHIIVAAVPTGQIPGVASDIASFSDVSAALQAAIDYYAVQEPSSPALLLLRQAHQLIGVSFLDAMRILAPAIVEKVKISIGGEAPFSLSFAQLSGLAALDAQSGTESPEARSYVAANRAEAVNLMRKVEQFYFQTEPSSPIPLLVERARLLVSKNFTELLKEMSKKDEPPAKGEKVDKN